jgi:hypothetical protein
VKGITIMAVTLEVPGSVDARIDPSGQVDLYRVYLDAGSTYSFDVFGGDDDSGGEFDPTLTLLKGGRLAYNDDVSGGDGYDSHIDWTAGQSGYYTLQVRGYAGEVGDYTIETDFA